MIKSSILTYYMKCIFLHFSRDIILVCLDSQMNAHDSIRAPFTGMTANGLKNYIQLKSKKKDLAKTLNECYGLESESFSFLLAFGRVQK